MSAISGIKLNQKVGLERHGAPLHACPKCRSYTDVRIENSRMIDKYLFWMSLKKYHCTDCQHQFHIVAR